jgi:hypothetical protein
VGNFIREKLQNKDGSINQNLYLPVATEPLRGLAARGENGFAKYLS